MSFNVASLSKEERITLHLDKRAALLIHQYKVGKITRKDIEKEINKVEEDQRECFRRLLNKYKGSSNGKQ